MIPVEELENRRAYKIQCRNLVVGFWDAEAFGFLGVREKFGDRYLFTEYHFDQGPPYGTAHALEALDVWLPEDVPLKAYLETVCRECGERTEQVWVDDDTFHTGKRCVGNKHVVETDCKPATPYFGVLSINKAAFDLLDDLDRQFSQDVL